MKRLPALPTLVACLVLIGGVALMGCQPNSETPAQLTLQTQNAIAVLPASAGLIGMVNLQDLQENAALNPFGEQGFLMEGMRNGLNTQLEEFLQTTGFNPETDLREVYLAASDIAHSAQPSMVVYANFNRDRLQAYLDEHLEDKLDYDTYNGIRVYRAQEGNSTFSFALATDNMIVAASGKEEVQAMLDRFNGSGTALKNNAETMRLIEMASWASSAWMVARDVDKTLDASGPSGSHDIERTAQQIGRALRDVVVSVDTQRDGVIGQLFMEPKSGIDASDIADLTKGLVAAMKATPSVDDNQMRLLDQINIRAQDDQVRINFFVDNEMINL